MYVQGPENTMRLVKYATRKGVPMAYAVDANQACPIAQQPRRWRKHCIAKRLVACLQIMPIERIYKCPAHGRRGGGNPNHLQEEARSIIAEAEKLIIAQHAYKTPDSRACCR